MVIMPESNSTNIELAKSDCFDFVIDFKLNRNIRITAYRYTDN